MDSLILSGLGWGGLPGWSIARELAHGSLVRIRAAALGPAARHLRGALLRCSAENQFQAS